MQNDFVKPIRSEYASDHDYMYAYAQALTAYNKKCMRAIDRETSRMRQLPTSGARSKPTGAERERYNLDSLHDYLRERPHLLERYKKHGIAGLLK